VAVTTPPPASSVQRRMLDVEDPVAHTPRAAVQWWAYVGAGFVLFWAYVLIRWITGPYFHTVQSGPSVPPTYMKVALITWQVASVPLVAFWLWKFLIKPWRRQRVVATDGLILLALLLMALQDPVSNYFGQWYNYNQYMVNLGSFVNDIPGWVPFARPGQQDGYPIFFHLLAYPLAFGFSMWAGCKIMGWAQRRRPSLGPVRLVAICFFSLLVFDFFLEALFWMPLGFYTMPGGHWSLFPGSFHKYPLHEDIFGAAVFTAPAALRFFKNDKGETLVERGIGNMKASLRRKTALRLLALCGAMQVIYLVTYNIPIAGWLATDPAVWPKAIQQTSYFNMHVCGTGTNRLCPGGGIPLTMDSWVNDKGQLQGPLAAQFRTYGLRAHPPGAFQGKVLGFTTN
jgi:hypothetical protein